MTRIRGRAVPPDDIDTTIDLMMGPREGGLTEEELEVAWEAYGERLTVFSPKRPGTRPWAHWRFVIGEEPPDEDGEPVRLAELGLLRDDEIAAIAERGNEAKARIGTPAEHYGPDYWPDRDAVELHEAVKAALQAEGKRSTRAARRLRGASAGRKERAPT